LVAVQGEWCLACLASSLKRRHTLLCVQGRMLPGAALFGVAGALATALVSAAQRACLGARHAPQGGLLLIVGCISGHGAP
jgi:hypothetical protein